MRGAWWIRGLVAAVMLAAALTLCSALTSSAASVGRGIVDNRLETAWPVDLATVPPLTTEIGSRVLGARWTRVIVHWTRLQPTSRQETAAGDRDGDGYQDQYVAELKAIVGAFAANGVNVILTPMDVPVWASDRRVWEGGYLPSYPPAISDPMVRAEFGRMAAFLAQVVGSRAAYLEVWNEPNMDGCFYPQTRPGDDRFGGRVYLEMLRTFSAAARAANPKAVVIAGATAPRGGNDERSTSPQRFARYLHDRGAQRYFDAYSHHVYPWQRPAAPAPDSRRAVALGNLSALTALFPGKPFFITEFGYATQTPSLLGCSVSELRQAAYLTQAYRFVAQTYPQVKAILWFMLEDLPPAPDRIGAYMGLRTTTGQPKLAWFAFAGKNTLVLTCSRSAGGGRALTFSGSLRSGVLGRLADKRLELQRLRRGSSIWTTVAEVSTSVNGAYSLREPSSAPGDRYRMVWRSVCQSRVVAAPTR